MKLLKNIAVGFLVSFIGSLPLGYLNIVGLDVRQEWGISGLVYYLFGVISIEAFVIYFTLIFAEKLSANKKLIRYIELFSIFFMILLAYLFYSKGNSGSDASFISTHPNYSPYLLGVSLNCVNFVQLPFWVGWNLYIINANFITTKRNGNFFYLGGTLAGTFAGMLLFVTVLHFVMNKSDNIAGYLMAYVIPLAFLGFALYQALRYYGKYHRKGVSQK